MNQSLSRRDLPLWILAAKLYFALALIVVCGQQGLSVLGVLQRWDAGHYLNIARNGYFWGNDPINAFFPLFPLLVRAFGWLGLSHLAAGLLLSNLCSLVGLSLFYRWVERRSGPRIANLSLLAALAQPGAMFFCLMYTESLFFLLLMVFLSGLESGRQKAALALAAFALPLTRSLGLLLLAPLGLERAYAWWKKKEKPEPHHWIAASGIVAGAALYFLLMKWFTGNAMAGKEAQDLFIFRASMLRFLEPWEFLKAAVDLGPAFHFFSGYVDRIAALAFLLTLAFAFWRKEQGRWFMLVLGIVPLVTLRFSSFLRFLIVVPYVAPIAAAFMDKRSWSRWFMYAAFAAGFVAYPLLIYRFSQNLWVAGL